MNKEDFGKQLCVLAKAFPGSVDLSNAETITIWFRVVSKLELETVTETVSRIVSEEEYLRPGTNLGAFILRRAKPRFSAATVEDALNRAIALCRNPVEGENCYRYLRNLDPSLEKMADRAGIFDRFASETDIRFRVKDVAKQYCERKENEKRGFSLESPDPTRALPSNVKQLALCVKGV